MQTIKKDSVVEIEVNKSVFIGFSFYVSNLNDINEKLNYVKNLHPKATHICFGYKTQEFEKSFDDGEPTSTAGIPILNCITKQNLSNVIVIVVRYFGGIKLGAGGLIRSYGKVASLVLIESKSTNLKVYLTYKLVTNYETYNNLILNNNKIKIKTISFNEDVTGEILVLENDNIIEKLKDKVKVLEKLNSVLERVE